jgi:hypothetical protein
VPRRRAARKYLVFDYGDGPRCSPPLAGRRVDVESRRRRPSRSRASSASRSGTSTRVLVRSSAPSARRRWWVSARRRRTAQRLGPSRHGAFVELSPVGRRRRVHTILRDQRTVSAWGGLHRRRPPRGAGSAYASRSASADERDRCSSPRRTSWPTGLGHERAGAGRPAQQGRSTTGSCHKRHGSRAPRAGRPSSASPTRATRSPTARVPDRRQGASPTGRMSRLLK